MSAAQFMIAAQQLPDSMRLGLAAGLFVLLVVGVAFLFAFALRRYLHRAPRDTADLSGMPPRSENAPAFMAASMQAVIQKLREQEKELEALHRRERERALQTERLSEAVTRNMPAGLLLVNPAGLITSANPAAEAALGISALAFRRYTEALGQDSPLS